MDYIFLSGVRPEIEDSRIKVRVSRKWDVYNLQDRFLSTDFVFIDEHDNYIHSVVWGNLARRLNDKLKEGYIYFIKNFSVVPNREKYRVVVNNDFMLELNAETMVKRVDDDVSEIPRHAFEFVELDNLEPNANEHFLDAIGVIATAGNLEQKDIRGSATKLLNIEIATLSGRRVRVTLWGKVALDFERLWADERKDVNIGIFTSMGVKKYANKSYLSSSRSTRFYINADIVEILEFRQKLESFDNLSDIVGVEGEFTQNFSRITKTISIGEMIKLGRATVEDEIIYIFTATIISVRTKTLWYYISCGENCKKGLARKHDGFWCDMCNKIVDFPLPRFRLELIVEDEHDQAMVIVFDDDAEFIVKAKAIDLTSKESEDDDAEDHILPDQIKNIVGSQYNFHTKASTFFAYGELGSFVCSKVSDNEKTFSTTTSPNFPDRNSMISEKERTFGITTPGQLPDTPKRKAMFDDKKDKTVIRKLDIEQEPSNQDSASL